jgi:peptide/nickel transport system substrate-binding protein
MARSTAVLIIVLIALAGCASPAQTRPARDSVAPAQTADTPKIITIAQQGPKEGFAPWFIGGPPGPLQWEELHSNFLVSADAFGTAEPVLAEKLPSLADGTIEVLPDGRMRTTWKLRPNIKWHDGQPFTTEDLLFGYEVQTHPEIPTSSSSLVRAVQTIEVTDPQSMVIIFRMPSLRIIEMGYRDLYPLPRHLLSEAFRGSKEAFAALPYWSAEYVHTGPFRLREFLPGEQMTFERFDDYYLGRPKADRVVIRIIPDNSAVVANLLAGSVDVAGELPTDLAVRLRDQWQPSGAGYVLSRQAFWRFVSIQFHPEWGGPPEVQQDVRARRGLAYAIDTEALRMAVVPGFPDTEGDTFMLKGDPRASVVGRPFATYRHDVAAATAELAEASLRRGSDGRMLNAAGQQVRLNLRAPTSDLETDLSAVARNWRELGFEVGEEITPSPLRRDNEYNVKFPGAEITAQGPEFWRRFDSRQRPTAENRYTGTDAGNYVNPAFDRLVDRVGSSLDDNEIAVILKDMGEIMAADLPALPLYFAVRTVVALQHVRGLDDIHGAPGRLGTTAKNAHLWDRS